MPKKSGSCQVKSATKLLTDISNNTTTAGVRASNREKKIAVEEKEGEDLSLDSLLLAHSELSDLIRQIDELIVQACKLRSTCAVGSREIQSFMHALSNIHSSLKPWALRFKQTLSKPSESEHELEQSLATETLSAVIEETSNISNSPEEPELGSLISPSPLVSWRAGCTVESGRQLFLLTPVPRSKVLSSEHHGSSRSVLEKVPNKGAACHTSSLPPFSIISGISDDDLLEKVEVHATPEKTKPAVKGSETTWCPLKFSNHQSRDHSMYLVTPLLKMSPLKTCMLLEPIPASLQQHNNDIPKSTPFAVRLKKCDNSPISESSGGQVSGCLISKYPELIGIQLSPKPVARREEVEKSPDWYLSPPKTCVLMEPSEENVPTGKADIDSSNNDSVSGSESVYLDCVQDKEMSGGHKSAKQSSRHGLNNSSLVAPESTPLWKVSTVQKGKQPGENTLKRELWTKFEAASTNVLRFDISVFQEKSNGFLARLEEASCNEKSRTPEFRDDESFNAYGIASFTS